MRPVGRTYQSCRRTVAVLTASAACVGNQAATAQPTPPLTQNSITVELSSDQVGPTTADPDGEGTFTISVRMDQGRICYSLTVEDIHPATGAHLHIGEAGRVGPIRLELEPPVDGSSQACMAADRDLLTALLERPQLFYVDVHNAEYPGAALRGQLGT